MLRFSSGLLLSRLLLLSIGSIGLPAAAQPSVEIAERLLHEIAFTPTQQQQLHDRREPPRVAIIIDDIGNRLGDGMATIRLPGALTYAVLPQTPYARELATQAHQANKEVILHQPLEAVSGKRLGPGGLTVDMDRETIQTIVAQNLASIPFVSGINNHMGSRFTSQRAPMERLLAVVQQLNPDLYFVDSRTTGQSVATQVAMEREMVHGSRQIFLDHDPKPAVIERQFQRLLLQVARHGEAIAIGHPYPQTTQVLQRLLPLLDYLGIALVPASQLVTHPLKRRESLWQAQASWSPSRPDLKN